MYNVIPVIKILLLIFKKRLIIIRLLIYTISKASDFAPDIGGHIFKGITLMKKYVSLAEETAENLRQMIVLNDTYKAGEALPSETKLSEMLNVSRTSVREAVKILIAENLLEIRRGVGTFVRSNPDIASGKFDSIYLSNKRQDLKDSLSLRYILEPAMIGMAIDNATPEELADIFELEKKCREAAIKSGWFLSAEFSMLDVEFHKAIAKATHNHVYEQLTPLLHQSISIIGKSVRDVDITKALLENAVTNHALIVEHMRQKDYEGTKMYAQLHVYNAVRLMGAD